MKVEIRWYIGKNGKPRYQIVRASAFRYGEPLESAPHSFRTMAKAVRWALDHDLEVVMYE